MKQVFISHVEEDKGRLTPYLDMILESDPGNIRLWIDRPHKIPAGGLFKRDDPDTVVGIEIGERWDDEIEKALKAVDAVLVFWSEKARIKESGPQREEIYYARRTGKLVAASFDDPATTPFHYPYIQVANLSEGNGPFADVLTRLGKLLRNGPVADIEEPVIDLYNAPYLANRERHAALIERQVNERKRVGHYVVPCHADDVFDKFAERLSEFDGPDIWKPDGSTASETWSKNLLGLDLNTDVAFLADDLHDLLQGKECRNSFNENIRHERPVVLYAQLNFAELAQPDIRERLSIWVETIDNAIAEYDHRFGADRDAGSPVCTILAAMCDPSKDADIQAACLDLGAGISPPRRLQKISCLNFQSWLSKDVVRKELDRLRIQPGELENEVRTTHFRDMNEVSMQKFHEIVLASRPWGRVLDFHKNGR